MFRVLKILKEFYLITFSPWEGNFVKILANELRSMYSQHELNFLTSSLKIIDIQERYYESLNASLFSLNEEILPDPLIRISDNVDILFEMGNLELVAEHNETCLISTRTLFLSRWLKQNLIDLNKHH
jgi:hypothetical protein